MAVLYSYRFLNHIDFEDIEVPAQRYLYKFEHHRKEIVHLKLHEKDFLFRAMKVIENHSGKHRYNLYKIPEAKEFVFIWIILLHANQKMDFDGRIAGPYGLLTPMEKRQNKRFFYEYFNVWKSQVQKGKGAYLSVIKVEIERKVKELMQVEHTGRKEIKKRIEFIYAIFFHIYYTVKQYFDERTKPFVLRTIGGLDVVFNTYSFIHILSRHYYSNMNKRNRVSLNDDFEIDLDYLPDEMLPLIDKSNGLKPITRETEYLLYSIGTDYYILWIS